MTASPALLEQPAIANAAAAAPQSLLRFLTCGSVDDGKSTLIGRMLYECGAVFEDQLVTLERDSKKFGTDGENLDFALLVDGLSAEREQGITIDVAYRYFSTSRRAFIVADTPGHEQYTRNMATGASTADVGILLVDARKGLLPQTRRHAFINSMLRVRHIVVAVNKMDLVDCDKAVFDKIEADFRAIAATLDFASIAFIPVSARHGDNVTKPSARMDWYRGPPLLKYLEEIEVAADARDGGGFLLPVQWVNRPNLNFRGFSGTIASGSIKPGDEISVMPGGRTSRVSRIVTADGDLDTAATGQAITLVLEDEIDISRGDVIFAGKTAASPQQNLSAHVIWTSAQPALAGSRYFLKLATGMAQARIDSVHHLLNIEDYTPRPAELIPMNGVALVTIALDKPIVAADYNINKMLGGFILIDRFNNETAAIGMAGSARQAFGLQQLQAVTPASTFQLWFEKKAGIAGSAMRARFEANIAWRALTAALLFCIAWAVTTSAGLAGLIALADAVVRPWLWTWHRKFWAPRLRAGEFNDSGGGI